MKARILLHSFDDLLTDTRADGLIWLFIAVCRTLYKFSGQALEPKFCRKDP